jgi:hypothetical protein
MKRWLSSIIILLFIFTCIAACTDTGEEVSTPTATQTPIPPTATATPLPTEDKCIDGDPPSNRDVDIGVNRDSVATTITISFRGGKGQYMVEDIDVRVTLSTGEVINEKLESKVNDEVVVQGTKGSDRIEVFVSYYDGTCYKVLDDYYEFGGHK